MDTKICTKCKLPKLFSDFYKNKTTSDGLHKQCKSCMDTVSSQKIKIKKPISEKRKEYLKEYAKKNKEKLKDLQKRYREKNKEKLQAVSKQKYIKKKQTSPESYMLYSARIRASTKNVPINIDIEDIIIPQFCPILGIELQIQINGKPQNNSPTLDRIIPELGYVKGNVQVISHRANALKNNATLHELVLLGEWAKTLRNSQVSDSV